MPEHSAVRRIIVLLDGSPADGPVVEIACLLSRSRGAELFLVAALVVDRTLPLDAPLAEQTRQATALLERAQLNAKESACLCQTRVLRARDIATALVDEAADLGCDLIVLGVGSKKHSAGFVEQILGHAPCAVWLYRARPGAEGT